MSRQFTVDCLYEIFEYLEKNYLTLHSCLLVNRFWCKVAVRILWRNIWNFQYNIEHCSYRTHTIIGTLVACLPNESKVFLNENGLFIQPPTLKSPLFNYPSFIKGISINKFDEMIHSVLENQHLKLSLYYSKHLIAQEIIKMFMNQIPSLKKLEFYWNNFKNIPFNIHFSCFPGAKDCLTDLSELYCNSDVYSEFFYQLSQTCHNLQSLTIEFRDTISSGLVDFISVQNNLKILNLISDEKIWTSIIPVLSKISNTLIKLKIDVGEIYAPTSFISSCINLQELILSANQISFKELQYVIFSNLQILKIPFDRPDDDLLTKFFENNGKNLKELDIYSIDGSLGSSIAKFCPNLKKISTILMDNNGLETLKILFNTCQYLESIKIWYGDYNSDEKEMLKIVITYSKNNFYELKIYHEFSSSLGPEDFESFLISWDNRNNRSPINLISIKDDFWNITLDSNKEIMKLFEKYKKLGIIKKFGIEMHFET
ncbi:hypothetical protein C1645_825143 [Glomus cerebriforme]|uniref:F-box domain-containing protein n=1 Tax=Glomus cerebriforme TaxID=658196 RepID=A0A397ST23_9GLOM|nr:hypothetical protein C1645_825143 [Glomus cerebriforme]